MRHEENPRLGFGEVSRMLGEEWKTMDPVKRRNWKDKALKMNEEARQQYKQDNPELFSASGQRLSLNHSSGGGMRDGPTGVQIFNNTRENPQTNQVGFFFNFNLKKIKIKN